MTNVDPLSLRMKVRINVSLEFVVGSDESSIRTNTERALEPLMRELEIIRKMNVPSETIEYRDKYQARDEIKEVRVSVSQSVGPKAERRYIVSYHTIRGKEIGICKTYEVQQLIARAID